MTGMCHEHRRGVFSRLSIGDPPNVTQEVKERVILPSHHTSHITGPDSHEFESDGW